MEHHPVLAEGDRASVAIGRDVPDGEERGHGSLGGDTPHAGEDQDERGPRASAPNRLLSRMITPFIRGTTL